MKWVFRMQMILLLFATLQHGLFAVFDPIILPIGTMEKISSNGEKNIFSIYFFRSSDYKELLGQKAKFLLETSRVRFLENELGFRIKIVRYVEREITPENLLIIGNLCE